MQIKPSEAIKDSYSEISRICKQTKEPVYLTVKGEGDLVVMDIEAFERREKMILLREELFEAKASAARGEPGYSIDEAVSSILGMKDE